MATHSQRTLGPLEVKRLDRPEGAVPDVVKKVDHDAKAGMGAVIRDAIGADALKAYGDPGLMSKVVSGEKVPDYLAAIYANDRARLRMAKSLLRSDGKRVRERTVFEIEETA